MATHLVVVQPFASYAKGDRITDAETVTKLLVDHHHRVMKINVEDPAPQGADHAPA